VIDPRDGRGSGDLPDGVVGDHLDERVRVPAAEGVEDATDVGDGIYRSRGASVKPWPSSSEW
jgi:hypothetical protein